MRMGIHVVNSVHVIVSVYTHAGFAPRALQR